MIPSLLLPQEIRYLTSLALRQKRTPPLLALSLRSLTTSLPPSPRPISTFARPLPPSNSRLGNRYELQRRSFHASSKREIALPALIWPLLGFLKSSAMVTVIGTITRVAVSFLPLHLFTFLKSLKHLRRYDPLDPHHLQSRPKVSQQALLIHYNSPRPSLSYPSFPTTPALSILSSSNSSLPVPPAPPPELLLELNQLREWEKKGEKWFRKKMMAINLILATLLGPVLIFGLVVLAGLERTPLTGRWRVLLISPEEEETIHEALLATGWFQAVLDVLAPSSQNPINIVPADDWRWNWVESTLRRLELGAQSCVDRHYDPSSPSSSPVDPNFPPPPPPAFPLHPRPRASQTLHSLCSWTICPPPASESKLEPEPEPINQGAPKLDGPPYQLLLLESPQANAFSYGFGGNGAAGVVVNTGMLDEILGFNPSSQPSSSSSSSSSSNNNSPPTQRKSLLSYFLPSTNTNTNNNNLNSSPPYPDRRTQPLNEPTEAQTLHLASILAHEMAHLLLSHHLETLSYSSVLLPSAINLVVDLVRVVLFPVTMIAGPFFNDAIGNLSNQAHSQVKLMHESCSSQRLEVEADLVGLRILSESSFNPYSASIFWNSSPSHLDGLTHPDSSQPPGGGGWFANWRSSASARQEEKGKSHPADGVRANAVRAELERWRREWEGREMGKGGG
ncbi:hypothetical protein BDY24DRAFT_438231 [Mrakia frigida]|uniref:uncharacterized protein n=1 Tax=Mrakia frigida TaxID=29902 RepID=UPI003FCC0489